MSGNALSDFPQLPLSRSLVRSAVWVVEAHAAGSFPARVAHGQALPKAIRQTDKEQRCGVGTATQDRCNRSTGRSRCSQRTRSRERYATEPATVCSRRGYSVRRIGEPKRSGRTCRALRVRADVNRPQIGGRWSDAMHRRCSRRRQRRGGAGGWGRMADERRHRKSLRAAVSGAEAKPG